MVEPVVGEAAGAGERPAFARHGQADRDGMGDVRKVRRFGGALADAFAGSAQRFQHMQDRAAETLFRQPGGKLDREEHTSELQSLMRISYAVFCLKKKKK